MKLVHMSDLHIGKNVNEFSMLEDQTALLDGVLEKIKEIKPHGVLLAGDIYDKSVPSAQAVEVFDQFLTKLPAAETAVFIISGNHDSPERLGFGNKLMEKNKVYISGVFNGKLDKFTLTDDHGKVNIYLLPFVKPAVVRPFFEGEEINTYDDAIRVVLENTPINKEERNVLVAHQFVIGGGQEPLRVQSENVSVGGVDHVDAALFAPFDYVALGHLHSPQKIGRETVRYCGSPLKYSFSESKHKKSLTVVELKEKGKTALSTLPLTPLRDLREIKGKLENLLDASVYKETNCADYLHVTLTDEDEVMDPLGRLRTVYPNIMKLTIENSRTKQNRQINFTQEMEQKTGEELFCEFYQLQNNELPQEEAKKIINEIFTVLEGKT